MVVRRFMNKTGVLKVFLIGSRKYAYLNTPMNEDVEYWRPYLSRDGKILVKLDKIMYGVKEAAYWCRRQR